MKTSIFLILLSAMTGVFFLSSCSSNQTTNEKNEKTSLTNSQILNSKELTIKDLDSLIRLNPKNDTLFYKRSKLQLAAKNIDEAINDLNLAIKVDSNNPEYYIELANLYIVKAKSEKSRDVLESAVKKFKKNHKVFTELGKLYFLVQDYKNAHKYLDEAIDLYPYDAKAYYYKAMAYLETKDTTKAKFYFNKAVEADPDMYDAYLMLGAIATEQKDTLAPEYFMAAIRIDSTNIEPRFSLGYYYQTVAKKYPEAVKEYEYIIQNMDSTYAHAYFNLGYMILFETDHPEASIPYFKKTIKYDSTVVDAYVNLGIAYKTIGKRDSAKFFLEKALKVKPNYDRAIKEINSL
jgi:tetratricopeptide (TPR) repeat protein